MCRETTPTFMVYRGVPDANKKICVVLMIGDGCVCMLWGVLLALTVGVLIGRMRTSVTLFPRHVCVTV